MVVVSVLTAPRFVFYDVAGLPVNVNVHACCHAYRDSGKSRNCSDDLVSPETVVNLSRPTWLQEQPGATDIWSSSRGQFRETPFDTSSFNVRFPWKARCPSRAGTNSASVLPHSHSVSCSNRPQNPWTDGPRTTACPTSDDVSCKRVVLRARM